jgi:hypothetical protein
MEMVEARERLEKIKNNAWRAWTGVSARYIEGQCNTLANLAVTANCAELASAVRELRAAEGFPGSLRAWTWFDEKLFALAIELDCMPTVARSTAADRARIRGSV